MTPALCYIVAIALATLSFIITVHVKFFPIHLLVVISIILSKFDYWPLHPNTYYVVFGQQFVSLR